MFLKSDWPETFLLDYLNKELRLGKKHLVLVWGYAPEAWLRKFAQTVHTLCYYPLEEGLALDYGIENLLVLKPNADKGFNLDADTMDCALIFEPNYPPSNTELRRVLRLNSYVLVLEVGFNAHFSAFNAALSQWFERFRVGERPNWSDFFGQPPQQKHQHSRKVLTWGELVQALAPPSTLAKKALSLLFQQQRTKDKTIEIQLHWQIHYGLFNRYLPAISLRKNLFFQLLRPLALGFYLIVKLNIYFWKLIYRLQSKKRPKGD